MPQRKPKTDPYKLRCDLCWKRGESRVFSTYKDYISHLKAHFIEAAPAKIKAIV
jgi:hypothetical protein